MTDNELLELMSEDDIGGMALLIDRYSADVYKIVADVLSGVASQRDTEDCIAESFIAFGNNICDVDLSRGTIKAYLGVIAQRRAVNLYYTLNPDDETVFYEYTVEEMNELTEAEETEEMPLLSQRIKELCLREIAPGVPAEESDASEDFMPEEVIDEEPVYSDTYAEDEISEEPASEETDGQGPIVTVRRKNSFFGRVLKTVVAAVTLVAVIAVAVIALDRFGIQEEKIPATKVTTTQTTTKASYDNPLFSAILSGNEKLIESLIANSLLLTQDILTFALESADKISYDTIRSIAEQVKEKYGSTGLDPLLDEAIFGNFESVRDRLSEKDESEMTPAEKLAWFFVTAMGNGN